MDDSARSVVALRWAAAEALFRDAVLQAVHALDSSLRPASYAPGAAGLPSYDETWHRAQERLHETVQDALGGAWSVRVREVLDPRRPVPALLDLGRGATLLVLATRAPGAAGSGLGPTALACLRHAPCPIVVLPVAEGVLRTVSGRRDRRVVHGKG